MRRSEFEGATEGLRIFNDENYKFGWLQGSRKLLREKRSFWLRGVDLNHRPLGYEPNELPDCSTPHFDHSNRGWAGQTGGTRRMINASRSLTANDTGDVVPQ